MTRDEDPDVEAAESVSCKTAEEGGNGEGQGAGEGVVRDGGIRGKLNYPKFVLLERYLKEQCSSVTWWL